LVEGGKEVGNEGGVQSAVSFDYIRGVDEFLAVYSIGGIEEESCPLIKALLVKDVSGAMLWRELS